MKKIAVLAAVLLLTACAQRGALNFTKLGPEQDPTRACLAELALDPVIQPLAARLGPFGTAVTPSIEMRASKDFASDDERPAISYWGSRRQACHELGAPFRAANSPPFWQSAMDWQTASLLGLMAKLYVRDLNYGQFIVERDRLAGETRAMVAAGSSQMQQSEAQLRQAQAAEASNAWRAVQAMQPEPNPLQPMIDNLNAQQRNRITCTTSPPVFGQTTTRCQ